MIVGVVVSSCSFFPSDWVPLLERSDLIVLDRGVSVPSSLLMIVTDVYEREANYSCRMRSPHYLHPCCSNLTSLVPSLPSRKDEYLLTSASSHASILASSAGDTRYIHIMSDLPSNNLHAISSFQFASPHHQLHLSKHRIRAGKTNGRDSSALKTGAWVLLSTNPGAKAPFKGLV